MTNPINKNVPDFGPLFRKMSQPSHEEYTEKWTKRNRECKADAQTTSVGGLYGSHDKTWEFI
jgi:hypothetical protein